MEDKKKKALDKHHTWHGKLEIKPRVDLIKHPEELVYAYTPGVAEPCLEIEKDEEKSYEYTDRWNSIAVITDGTAVLGLGDIGPVAGMPVMEGKCVLFKTYGDIDAVPLCIKTKDVDELVRTIYLISGSFGGINLEDISAPRCFEVERRLKEICDIPIFHDDQHGTAIVVAASVINALKVVKKDIKEIKCVINGAGAAGISIGKLLLKLGLKNLTYCDKMGIIYEGEEGLNSAQEEISHFTNLERLHGALKDALVGADLFIGVSGPNLVSVDMIKSMNKDAICFPMANPVPEISYEDCLKAGARIIGTGRSDYPNQINNLLVFPGIFRGALDARSKVISDEMIIAAVYALSSYIKDEDLNEHNIIPKATDVNVHKFIARRVKEAALKK